MWGDRDILGLCYQKYPTTVPMLKTGKPSKENIYEIVRLVDPEGFEPPTKAL